MQKLGQHFLLQRGATRKIVDALSIEEGDTILEIGGGHGELTVPLAEACTAHNARLISIERDGELVTHLRTQEALSHAQIIYGDVLHELPKLVHGEIENYKIVGNIPYYLTGRLFRILGALTPKPSRTVLMIQKEVALRLTAHPPHMNRLAAAVQFWAEPRTLFFVPRTHFNPPPEVDSAVVALTRKSLPHELVALQGRYEETMRMLFSQPRKTILNNLTDAAQFSGRNKKEVAQLLQDAGIDPTLRPQNETIDDIIRIARLDS